MSARGKHHCRLIRADQIRQMPRDTAHIRQLYGIVVRDFVLVGQVIGLGIGSPLIERIAAEGTSPRD